MRAFAATLALSLALGGCGSAEQVPFEATEVIRVDEPAKAWQELFRYLNPKSTHAPLQLTGKQKYYYGPDLPAVHYVPRSRQLVLQWDFEFPSAVGDQALEFKFVTAFEEADATSFEIWNAEADGEGWFVTADCDEFWSGELNPDPVLASLDPGRASFDEDGFNFPSAAGLAFAGKTAPDFKIGNLNSRRECLRVIGILTTVFDTCGFGAEEPPAATTVEASVPRPGSGTVRGGYVPGGYKR